jgi:hypothetical protein
MTASSIYALDADTSVEVDPAANPTSKLGTFTTRASLVVVAGALFALPRGA